MDRGMRIVGWFLTAGVGIVTILWAWILFRTKDPDAALGRLARPQLLFFGALLAQSLAMALGYPSSPVGWTLNILAVVFTIAYVSAIWPIFVAHLRSVGLSPAKTTSRGSGSEDGHGA